MRNFLLLSVGTALNLVLIGCGSPADSAEDVATDTAKEASAAPVDSAVSRGRAAFGECAACHAVAKGAPHGIGPNLYGVYGAKAGTQEGFPYSSAVQKSGLVWTDENLDAFIESPQNVIRGNRMGYFGKKQPKARADIVAYLATLTD